MRPLFAAVATTLALHVAISAPCAAARTYHNDALRLRAFDVPRGWRTTSQLPYPGILVLATGDREARGPEGARLTLAWQRLVPGTTTALALAADARAALLREGFGDPRLSPLSDERVQLETDLPPGALLRQVYLVDGDLAFVVTLFAPPAKRAQALRDFEEAVQSLVVAPAQAPEAVDEPAPPRPDAGP